MFDGLDGAIHLAEDCSNAAVAVPLALMSTVVIGFITSFTFTVAMIYCVKVSPTHTSKYARIV